MGLFHSISKMSYCYCDFCHNISEFTIAPFHAFRCLVVFLASTIGGWGYSSLINARIFRPIHQNPVDSYPKKKGISRDEVISWSVLITFPPLAASAGAASFRITSFAFQDFFHHILEWSDGCACPECLESSFPELCAAKRQGRIMSGAIHRWKRSAQPAS